MVRRMRKIRSLVLLSMISIVLLIGGCATAPDVDERERISSPEPSTQSIGVSEPDDLKAEKLQARELLLEDSESEVGSDGAASSVDGVHEKLERQSDDMERLD